jgi:hypothetical protein
MAARKRVLRHTRDRTWAVCLFIRELRPPAPSATSICFSSIIEVVLGLVQDFVEPFALKRSVKELGEDSDWHVLANCY